ncbi:MAG: ABC transporter ATP-binding protein [Clostridia bacterium]|nr:ABC transporter ATP-binding protein [Clostridia bacterium]
MQRPMPMGPGGGRRGGPGGMMHEKVKLKSPKKTIRRLLSYFKGKLGILALAVLLSGVTAVLGIITTRFNGLIIDEAIDKQDLTKLVYLCLTLLGLYIFNIGATYLQNRVMVNVSHETAAKLRANLFRSMQGLSLSYFDQHSSGDLMSRLTNDVDNISMTLSQNLVHLFSGIVNLLGILIAMLILSPPLTLISLLIVPVMILSSRLLIKFNGKLFKRQQRELGELNGYVEEMISGQKVVLLFGQEEETRKRFSFLNRRLKNTLISAQGIGGIFGPVMNTLNNISFLIVAVAGATLVADGTLFGLKSTISVGVVFSFVMYMRNFSRPINEIANLLNSLQLALAGAERVFEVMDAPKETDAPSALTLESTNGNVGFEDISFSYIPGTPVLKSASFEAKSGQTIAIVGPTGAGKTTIISLLTRFYDYEKGQILIDGAPITDYTRDSMIRQIGLVLQDAFLFSDTVRNNIAYGRPDATEEEIIRAAKLANAHHFITQLPKGYDTILSDGASNLSKGQRQLLTIARTILMEPAILILDEATSSVDTRTELKIQEALLNLMEGRTSFVIAHRLSTIRSADEILVIDHGELIERGTHDQLLKKDGFYATLYQSQFKSGLGL